jgi:hypothetical protein
MFFDDSATAFTRLASVLRPHGRLAFLSWQDDAENEVFTIPLRAFAAYVSPSGPSADRLFTDPRQIITLLSGTGWGDIQVTAVSEPARLGSDVDDVLRYTRSMPVMRNLMANLNDPVLSKRALAAVAEQYLAYQRPDGVWVRAAAWLVTARRRTR